MIKTEAKDEMSKERKDSFEIINTLGQVLTTEPKTVYAISSETEVLGNSMHSETILRYVELIKHIQDTFQDKKIQINETKISNRTYRTIQIVSQD